MDDHQAAPHFHQDHLQVGRLLLAVRHRHSCHR